MPSDMLIEWRSVVRPLCAQALNTIGQETDDDAVARLQNARAFLWSVAPCSAMMETNNERATAARARLTFGRASEGRSNWTRAGELNSWRNERLETSAMSASLDLATSEIPMPNIEKQKAVLFLDADHACFAFVAQTTSTSPA